MQQQQHQQQGRGYPHAPYPINHQSSYSSAPPPPEIEIYRRRVEELEAEKMRLSQQNIDMNNELFDLKACSAASATEAKVEARKEIEKVQSEAKLRERDLERLTKENQSLLRQLSTLKQQPPTSSSSSLSNGINGGLNGVNGTNGVSNSMRMSGGGAWDNRNDGRSSARSNDSNGARSTSPRNAANVANGNGNNSARSTSSRHSDVSDGGGGGANSANGTHASLRDENSLTALQSVMHMAPGQGLAITTQPVVSAGGNVAVAAATTGGSGSDGIIDGRSGCSSGNVVAVSCTSLPMPPLPAAAAASSSSVTIINQQQLSSFNSNTSASSNTTWPPSKGYCVASGSLIAALLPLYQRLLIRPLSLSTRGHTRITRALETMQGSFHDMIVQISQVTSSGSVIGLGGVEGATYHRQGNYGEGSAGDGSRKRENSSSSSGGSSTGSGSMHGIISGVNVRVGGGGGNSSGDSGVVGVGANRTRDDALIVSLQLIALTGSAVALTQAVVDQDQHPDQQTDHHSHPHSHPHPHSHSRHESRGRGGSSISNNEEKIAASPSPRDASGSGDGSSSGDGDGDDSGDEDTRRGLPAPLTDEHIQYLHDCLVLVHALTGYLDIEAVHLLIAARLVSGDSNRIRTLF